MINSCNAIIGSHAHSGVGTCGNRLSQEQGALSPVGQECHSPQAAVAVELLGAARKGQEHPPERYWVQQALRLLLGLAQFLLLEVPQRQPPSQLQGLMQGMSFLSRVQDMPDSGCAVLH